MIVEVKGQYINSSHVLQIREDERGAYIYFTNGNGHIFFRGETASSIAHMIIYEERDYANT